MLHCFEPTRYIDQIYHLRFNLSLEKYILRSMRREETSQQPYNPLLRYPIYLKLASTGGSFDASSPLAFRSRSSRSFFNNSSLFNLLSSITFFAFLLKCRFIAEFFPLILFFTTPASSAMGRFSRISFIITSFDRKSIFPMKSGSSDIISG